MYQQKTFICNNTEISVIKFEQDKYWKLHSSTQPAIKPINGNSPYGYDEYYYLGLRYNISSWEEIKRGKSTKPYVSMDYAESNEPIDY
jgi:hypothetical protein